MQTPKGEIVKAITSLAVVGPRTFATVQEPFWYDWLLLSPTWGIQQRNWKSPENLTLKVSRVWLQKFHRTGENRDSWRAQTKACAPQDPVERSSDPTRDWADPPVSGWGSPAAVWVHHGPPRDWGTGNSSPGRCCVLASVLLEEVPNSSTMELPRGRSTNWRSYQVGEGQWQK